MVGVDLGALPYRCPRCEHNADFPTLEGLRQHLASDHAYSCTNREKCSRPKSRPPEVSGRLSPLTESFLRQRQLLEQQLRKAQLSESESHRESQSHEQCHCQNHCQHHCQSTSHAMGDVNTGSPNASMLNSHTVPGTTQAPLLAQTPFCSSETHAVTSPMQSLMSPECPDVSCRHGDDITGRSDNVAHCDDEVPEDGLPLSVDQLEKSTPASRRTVRRQQRRGHDLTHQREVTNVTWSKWEMADALAKARDHVDSMKRTADSVVQQQAVLIELLRQELKGRDERLDKARKQLAVLHGDRQRLLGKVGRLSRDQDYSADSIAHLTATLEEKDRCIKDKQREVGQLVGALQGASQKERSAKAHLEAYIQELTAHANQAETTLTSFGGTGNMTFGNVMSLGDMTSCGNMTSHGSGGVGPHYSPASSAMVYTSRGGSAEHVSPHWTPLQTTNAPTSLQSTLHGAAQTEQVNTCVKPTLLCATPPFGSTPYRATPTVTTLSLATPPFTPPVESPIRTDSTISGQSLLATSGCLSHTSGPILSSTPYANHSKKTAYGDPPLLSLNAQTPNGSLQIEGFMSPLSPGEVIMNQPLWFKSQQSDGKSRQAQEQEGEESALSDSQESMSGNEALGVLSFCPSHITSKYISRAVRPTDRLEAQGDPHGSYQQSERYQQSGCWRSSSYATRQLQKSMASWGSKFASDHVVSKNNDGTCHSATTTGVQWQPPVPKPDPTRWMYEALPYVFRYLDTRALCDVALVCHTWREMSREPALWRKVCLKRAAVSPKFLRTMSRWCTELQSLTLEGLSGRPQRKDEMPEQYKKAVRGSLEGGLEVLLEVAGDALRSLRVTDCGNILTDRCLWLASCHSRLLERVAYVSDSDPAGSEVIWALGAGCRHIHTLIIPPKYPNAHPRRFTDRCLTMAAACWPELLMLCIGGVEITEKGLTTLAKTCTRLQVLELDHLCEVTEDIAVAMCHHGLRGLQTLEFSSTPVTPRALLHFVSSCASLRTVRIKLSIVDYFKDTQDVGNQQHYRDVISKLKLVQSRPGMSDVIHIQDSRPTSWRK